MASVTGRPGRPKAISREMLAEAACELFLEQGYEQTSVSDIARRAGIARSSAGIKCSGAATKPTLNPDATLFDSPDT